MKILVLSHMYPRPEREHYGVFVHESVLALRERGHEITVVAPLPRTPPGIARLKPDWRRIAATPSRRELDGIEIHHPRYLLLPRGLAFASAARRMARAVLALGLGRDFDLLHAHAGVPDGAAARRIAAALGLPYYVTSHGSDVLRSPTWSPAVHGELHDGFRSAAGVFFPSSRALRRAEAAGLPVERGRVLWNGYRRDLFLADAAPAARDDGRLRVICVANLVPSKRVDLLVVAIARLVAQGRQAELHLVGDGPERDGILARAQAAGVPLAHSPRLTREELAVALRAADCFALPARGESFGIVYLEAMASGLPVVAPDDEGIADIVAHDREGLLVGDDDSAELSEALSALAMDPPRRRRLGEAARTRAADLGWNRHAREFDRLHEQLAAPACPPGPRGRVFHLLYSSEPDRSGYAIRSRYILSLQRRLGWIPQASTGPFQHSRWSAGPRETRDGLTYHRLDLPGTDRRRGRLGWRRYLVFVQKAMVDRLLAKRLAGILRTEQPEILHAHSPAFNLNLARRARRRAGLTRVPIIYEVRGLTEETASLVGNTRAGGLLYRVKRRIEERAMQRAEIVVAISAGLRDDFVDRGIPAGKIHLLPNGADCAAIPLAAADAARARELGLSNGKTLGFVGSMGRLEGLPWLVEQLAALPPDWRLLLVGDGQDRGPVLERAAALGIAERVIAPGSVPHAQVGSWYGLLDYIVLPRPSLRVTERVTPLKPLEAMAAGGIVLASDIGGHREIVEHGRNGFLFDLGDPAAFRALLLELSMDADRRESLRAGARHWVETERDWSVLVPRYEAIYAAATRLMESR